MASGDIVFQSSGRPANLLIPGVNGPVSLDMKLFSESAQNVEQGNLTISMRGGEPPYGQGWTDERSPFTPGKQYRVVITEL